MTVSRASRAPLTALPGTRRAGKKLGVSSDGRRWTGHYYEPFFGSYVGVVTMQVHDPVMCAGRELPCALHHPSDHALREMELQWRADAATLERRCEHGVGHPDPDDVRYNRSLGRDVRNHGCDGCCLRAVAEKSQVKERLSLPLSDSV